MWMSSPPVHRHSGLQSSSAPGLFFLCTGGLQTNSVHSGVSIHGLHPSKGCICLSSQAEDSFRCSLRFPNLKSRWPSVSQNPQLFPPEETRHLMTQQDNFRWPRMNEDVDRVSEKETLLLNFQCFGVFFGWGGVKS